jgi:hypothetical protein
VLGEVDERAPTASRRECTEVVRAEVEVQRAERTSLGLARRRGDARAPRFGVRLPTNPAPDEGFSPGGRRQAGDGCTHRRRECKRLDGVQGGRRLDARLDVHPERYGADRDNDDGARVRHGQLGSWPAIDEQNGTSVRTPTAPTPLPHLDRPRIHVQLGGRHHAGQHVGGGHPGPVSADAQPSQAVELAVGQQRHRGARGAGRRPANRDTPHRPRT